MIVAALVACTAARELSAQDVGAPATGDAAREVRGASDAGAPEPAAAELRLPELTRFVNAEYPARARAQGLEARVVLTVEIDALGNVTRADATSRAGHGFDEAAEAAVRQFQFTPASRGGVPVRSRISYVYEFQLDEPAPSTDPRVAPAPPLPPSAAAPLAPAPADLPPRAAPAVHVTVLGASRIERLRRSAQAIKVIDTSEARRHTADVGEVLARTEGVRVQRSGGLGSETRLSLHGLTDDQIRVFLDGVALELAGFGLGVSTVPINWLERIEVYRGVVPPAFGSDALGGAVNLVTDGSAPRERAALSYAAGAFDTHQVALDATEIEENSRVSIRTNAFYDTSENDYVVRVRVPDELGRLRPATVRRFHDGYRAAGAALELGLLPRAWTRRSSVRLFFTDFDKELQHNVNMSVPYGEVTYGQTAFGGTLRFESLRAREDDWGLTALAGYGYRSLDFRDVSRWVYDWFGNRVFERAEGSGEVTLFARDLTQWEQRALARVTLSRGLGAAQTLRLVVAPDFTARTGRERRRVNPARIDPLTTRRNVLQLTSALEHVYRDEDDRIDNSAFAKHYLYRPDTEQVRTFDNSIEHIEDSVSRFGAGDAFRVRVGADVLMKASYEYATRLPRPDEVFGDGALTLPNLELEPEASHNGNLGVAWSSPERGELGQLDLEVAGFVRQTQQMVVRLLAQDRVHSIHQNVFDVRTLGFDAMLGWHSRGRWVSIESNATLQDQRNDSARGPFTPFAGQRVPNRPWFFANAALTLRAPNFTGPRSELSAAWLTRYVREFLPGWEDTSAPDDSNRIPDQLIHTLSFTHSLAARPATLDVALDITNITDARAYDVLGVQRPGRAAFFKLTVCWACAADEPMENMTDVQPNVQ